MTKTEYLSPNISDLYLRLCEWFQPTFEQPGKIYISGTVRAGTSALMQLLTELRCDTGYRPADV